VGGGCFSFHGSGYVGGDGLTSRGGGYLGASRVGAGRMAAVTPVGIARGGGARATERVHGEMVWTPTLEPYRVVEIIESHQELLVDGTICRISPDEPHKNQLN
jgi:hypothetical protein